MLMVLPGKRQYINVTDVQSQAYKRANKQKTSPSSRANNGFPEKTELEPRSKI